MAVRAGRAGRVLDVSVGQFKDGHAAQMRQVESLISKSKASSEGSVLEAGVVSVTPTAARVFVAADSRTTSAADSAGTVQHYRMQIDLMRSDDRWLVSDVAYVSQGGR